MRASMHCGKGYIKHQDHEKTKRGRDHIDYDLTKNNSIWTRSGQIDETNYTAEEGERKFYNLFFSKTLNKQNEKYEKKGNYKRIRTMDEWMLAKQHSPAEQIMQVGNKKEFIPMDKLKPLVYEFINWKLERFEGNYEVISVTGHVDEKDHADHFHIREVWYSHDEEGLPVPGIKAGLRELGVALPDPNESEGAMNYRKKTVDMECRAKWHEIILSHGYQIETEPDKTRKFGHMGQKAWNAYQDALDDLREREEEIVKKEKNASEMLADAEIQLSEAETINAAAKEKLNRFDLVVADTEKKYNEFLAKCEAVPELPKAPPGAEEYMKTIKMPIYKMTSRYDSETKTRKTVPETDEKGRKIKTGETTAFAKWENMRSKYKEKVAAIAPPAKPKYKDPFDTPKSNNSDDYDLEP